MPLPSCTRFGCFGLNAGNWRNRNLLPARHLCALARDSAKCSAAMNRSERAVRFIAHLPGRPEPLEACPPPLLAPPPGPAFSMMPTVRLVSVKTWLATRRISALVT